MNHWFGEPWNPIVCQPWLRVPTPIYAFCAQCERPVLERDQGVLISGAPSEVFHLNCFLHNLGCWPCTPKVHPPTKETLS
jgi:hypothetical protein